MHKKKQFAPLDVRIAVLEQETEDVALRICFDFLCHASARLWSMVCAQLQHVLRGHKKWRMHSNTLNIMNSQTVQTPGHVACCCAYILLQGTCSTSLLLGTGKLRTFLLSCCVFPKIHGIRCWCGEELESMNALGVLVSDSVCSACSQEEGDEQEGNINCAHHGKLLQ